MELIKSVRIALYAFILLGSPLASAVAEGELDGTWKAPPIGTKATYNHGASWEVISVDGNRVYVQGDRSTQIQDVSWYLYRGLFDSISSSGAKIKFDPAELDALFPLKIGNKTTLSGNAGGWKWKTLYKVTKHKEVETILGKRPVFVIAFLERGDDNYKAKGWGYYDPKLGIWHRGTYAWGDNDPYKWKLLHLEVPE